MMMFVVAMMVAPSTEAWLPYDRDALSTRIVGVGFGLSTADNESWAKQTSLADLRVFGSHTPSILLLNTGAPEGCVLNRPPLHTVHPWLHYQPSGELYCEVCSQHHHQTYYKQWWEFILGGNQQSWMTHRGQATACQQNQGSDCWF